MRSFNHVVLLKTGAQNNGGLEKYASRIASAFAERGAKISILTTGSEKPSSIHPQITFYPTRTSKWPSFLRMEQFDRYVQNWLKNEPADLIFGMDRNRFQTHIRAGNGVHISYLKSRILTEGALKHWMCNLNPKHRKMLELEKTSFENPRLEKIFANSYMVRNELLENFAIDPKKITVIHNGVEWNEMETPFSQREQGAIEFANRFHIDPHRFHFLFVGNGYLRKGLGVLLKALSRIKSKDFLLSVVGKDNKMEYFQAKAIQYGLKDKIRFFGSMDDITPFYQLCDVLVIPSFYDPFANVTIEALAMGLFIVSSKQNGGHEILNKQNGIVIDDLMDGDCLTSALEYCLSHRKTKERANLIRQSVAHLDFSKQLNKLIKDCE